MDRANHTPTAITLLFNHLAVRDERSKELLCLR
jgi:hypothetical protein